MYCGLNTASVVFLIFKTQLYQYFSVFFLFALFSEEPEVFLPKYSQTAIILPSIQLSKLHFSGHTDGRLLCFYFQEYRDFLVSKGLT